MDGVPSEQRISQALSHSERFVQQYYPHFGRSIGKYYTDESRVVWNGSPFTGTQFKQEQLPDIQKALGQFEVTSYDAQPMGSDSSMVSVSGTARLARDKVQFSQYFVLKKAGTLTYILSDCFRLV
ncbi:hypothetical protein GGF46_002106 [Coemansia sp. RSA 552]|nr:hypothetical protein GGF46_002106 [Coemansia sp. RSA 552]